MRRVVLLSDSEREAFLRFCEAVRNTEEDKDTFLKAARLERYESKLGADQVYGLKLAIVFTKFFGFAFSLIAVAVIISMFA